MFIHSAYKSLHLLIPASHSIPPPPPCPFVNHKSILYVCESVSVSWITSSVSYFRVYVSVILYGICRSLSDLNLLSMIISRSIHIATNGLCSFFLWLNSIPLYICITSSFSIHVSMEIQVVSMYLYILLIQDKCIATRINYFLYIY